MTRPAGTAPADRDPVAADVPAGAWQVMAVVFMATVVISLSSTMLTIALPTIAADLDATAGQTGWALTAYLLTNTATMLLMGQLADALDRRLMFLAGLGVFTATSLALALSGDVLVLVLLRGLQGLGGAMLLCNAVAVLVAVFPGRLLGRAMGIYLAGFSIAQVAGPALGGLVTAWLGWRYLFLCTVPICLVALLWGRRALARVPLPRGGRVRVDVPGNLLVAGSLVGVLTGVTFAPDRGWTDPWVLGGIVAGLALLPVLWRVERHVAHPVLDLRLLADRAFARTMLAGFLVACPRLSLMVAAGLYFQGRHGATPLEAAGQVTLAAVGLTVGALVADPLARTAPERLVALAGAAGSVLGLVLLAWAVGHGDGGGPGVQVGLLVVGLGTGLFHPLNVSTLMRAVPLGEAGSVNALRVTLQSTSLALATAGAVALAVSWVDPTAAAAFVSGDPASLTRADVEGIVLGHQVLFGVLAVLVLLGMAAAGRSVPDPVARAGRPQE